MIQAISFRGDRSPVPPRVKIGFESDNLVESLAFELPEISGNQSAMLMISGNAYANMIDLYRAEDGKWAVDMTAEMVGPAGVYESYVAITCPDGRRWNSGVFDLLTGNLPDISGAIETLYPTAVEHVLQEMAETRHEMAASVTASEDAAQRAEDAAQRAEDAANQGGGGEAPAKDAVLYTAQTLTEEQQTQARENIGAASAEAVGQLSEDKADYFEVGSGLQMSKDRVLSAVGGSEGVYEPIMTIEVTSEDQRIVTDETPDGRKWDFSAIMVFVNLNGGAMLQDIGVIFWGKPNFGETVFGYMITASSGNKRVRCEMYIDRGVWKGEFTTTMTGNEYYGSQNLVSVSRDKPVQEYPAIYGISTSKWPVGTTFDIYGVWKDE